MKCVCCNHEINEYDVDCPNCGQFILKYRFYFEHETNFNNEQELLSELQNNKTQISFLKRTKVLELATNYNKFLPFAPYISILLLLILNFIVACSLDNYWSLMAIPFIVWGCFSRNNIGVGAFILGIVSYIFRWNIVFTIVLGMLSLSRLAYTLWYATCKSIAQKVLLGDMRLFYLFWFNDIIALNRNGQEIQFHSFHKNK